MEIQENLNTIIDEHKAIYDDTDGEPISLSKKDIQNLLIESGVPEEITTKIEKSYVENFGDDLPLAENLIDAKALKVKEQRKREEHLEKQVQVLRTRLEQVTQAIAVDNETPLSTTVNADSAALEEASENNLEEIQFTDPEDNKAAAHYDVILQVNPEKISQIKSQIIDGQKCIVIPINEDEQATVNGLDNLI